MSKQDISIGLSLDDEPMVGFTVEQLETLMKTLEGKKHINELIGISLLLDKMKVYLEDY